MSRKFIVVSEAPADFATAADIADRVLVEQIDWLDESLLDSQRTWVGEEPPGSSLTWKSIPGRARDAGIRAYGHFAGEPGLPDARAARRAIAYVLSQIDRAEAILLIRDADDQIERRQGLEQARAVYATACRIAIGVAVCERESWVIGGFEPRDGKESQRLRDECQKLGFDPCQHPENLTARKDGSALKSPKRVLDVLTDGDRSRQRECWRVTALGTLRVRGERNGLREYMEEVKTHLVPVITGYEAIPPR